MKKAIVLFSGGMDSAVALHIAKADGYEPIALIFHYGQRHIIEASKAAHYCLTHGPIRRVHLDLPKIGGSALTDHRATIPHHPLSTIGQSIPPTYVPGRNLILLSFALNCAEAEGAEAIYLGINHRDSSGYPDCTPAFLQLFQEVARVGTRGGVRIEAPLLHMSKADIVRKGRELGVDFNATWSCYDPRINTAGFTVPCHVCDACQLRRQGFEQA